MRYTIYGAKRSSNFAIEAALAEAGAEYDFINVNIRDNEQRSDKFAQINPTRKIPALKLPSGEIITESAAILLTIADRHPEAKLLPPQGSAERAFAYRWIAFLASEVYPIVEIEDYPERFAPTKALAPQLGEIARERIRDRFVILEKGIAGNPWLLASGFCIADLYAANLTSWAGKDWRAAHCPKIERLAAAVAARPKVAPIWARHFGDR